LIDNAFKIIQFVCSQKSAVNQIFGQHHETELHKLSIKIALELQTSIQNMITRAWAMNTIHFTMD